MCFLYEYQIYKAGFHCQIYMANEDIPTCENGLTYLRQHKDIAHISISSIQSKCFIWIAIYSILFKVI